MNPALAKLRELSALDGEIRRLDSRRAAEEERVAQARRAAEETESAAAGKSVDTRALQKEVDAFNLDEKAAEAELKRFEEQVRIAKSNKEYEVLMKAVTAAKEKKSALEDEVLVRLEQLDEMAAGERRAEVVAEDSKQALQDAERALREALDEIEEKSSELAQRRSGLTSEVDPELLHLYERLLASGKDPAVAAAREGVCRACSRRLTAQTENLVALGEEIIQCMNCRRILYMGDGSAW